MIKKIAIKKLFGRYDYSFPLHSKGEDTTTFITGSNGTGKTTILRMINSTYFMNWSELVTNDFRSFTLEFDDCVMSFERKYSPADDKDKSDDINTQRIEDFELSVDYTVGNSTEHYILGRLGNFIDTPNSIAMSLSLDKPHYIDDQRLTYSYNEFGEVIEAKRLEDCRHDLIIKMQSLKSRVNEILSPFYVRKTIGDSSFSSADLCLFYENLRVFGILNVKPLEKITKDSDEYARLVSTMEMLLQEIKKTETFEYYESICNFAELIASYTFDNKQLELSTEHGLRFISTEKKLLTLDQLSSGEQQVLLQIYELMFVASKDSVILIDEPETSQHLAWQLNYYRNLKIIAANRHLQCIIATHLPLMFENNFSLAVDLYTLAHPEEF